MMIIASQNQMKIFRYKLRNGDVISCLLFLCLLCLFVASFRLLRGCAVDVANTANGLDSFETVQLMAELLAQVTHVHIDAAVERRKFASQHFLDEVFALNDLACVLQQD